MSNGFSKAGLGRLHDVMAGHVERGGIPGLVTLVSRRGETHVDATGTKTLGGRDAVQRDTIFRIASLTKPVVAVAALILVEECRLRLDDPVDELLPELANRRVLRRLDGPVDDTVPASRPITLRDLLTFRLGFGMIMAPPDTYPIQKAVDEAGLNQGPTRPQETVAPDEWMRRFGALPLLHQPGERWMYHTGFEVLGVLIARAAGQPLETFLRERIFAPLGMKDTGFSVPASTIDRLATSYWNNWQTGAFEVFDEARSGQWSRPPAFPSGGGGLVSTVDDFHTFGRMLLNKGQLGRARILSRPSIEAMTTDQLTSAQKAASGLTDGYFEGHGWGFGVAMVTRRENPCEPVGQFGWDGGLGTSWRCDPQEDIVAILMTQRAWTSPNPPAVCRDFWTLVYAAIEE
jgi:CubicO group peptidase (beta-lactamase class C family)